MSRWIVLGVLLVACQGDARADGDTERTRAPVVDAPKPATKPRPKPRAKRPVRPVGKDRGIYPELNPKVEARFPSWLQGAPYVLVRSPKHGTRYVYVDGVPVGLAASDDPGPEVRVTNWSELDRDGDDIPDTYDVYLGAKKADLNGASYKDKYQRLAYPGGDVPRTEGVCTDVVVRAVRNAGLDLQRTLHEDIKRRRKAFPMIRKRPNPHIDHRRVKTLLPHFLGTWERRAADPKVPVDLWLPGDVLFMQTMGDKRPDHLGIVGDRLGVSGLPVVINNWTDGSTTDELDILGFVEQTHRFRIPGPAPKVEAAQCGLQGVLARNGVTLGAEHQQVVLVTAAHWGLQAGWLRRFERRGDSWRQLGRPIRVSLGAKGMGQGRGLVPVKWRSGPVKKEGDERSPAGVFGLGASFGKKAKGPGAWAYQSVDGRDVWVDDPGSALYNTWQREPMGQAPMWGSAEAMKMYDLGLVIEHNTDPVKVGAGSAIFAHTRGKTHDPSLGCTTMPRRRLEEVVRWLAPAKKPVWVQLPAQVLGCGD